MFVKNYFYATADLQVSDKSMIIAETENRRSEYFL